MDLSVEQVQSSVRFLEAYANTALTEVSRLLGTDEPEDLNLARRSLLIEDPAFSIAADAATALREAGQWLLYLDPERSRTFLRRSGALFHAMGQAFGTYLVVVSEANQDPPYGVLREPLTVLMRTPTDEPSAWQSLRHPQQQAYLVLAASGSPAATREFGDRMDEIFETSVHREGVVPVGALGTPIRLLWDVARHLSRTGPESLRVIARHLAAMCRRYAETMELAQVNTHLWRHGAAPVDVGDIDIAGIAALAAHQHGGDAVLRALGDSGLLLDRDRVALAPVNAGLALAEPWRGEPRRG